MMLMFDYPFVIYALVLCLLLSGVYTFLGYHVVRRGVIFVDLALAQVAALGASVGILLGFGEHHPTINYMISLGFTLFGAWLFVLFRAKREKVPIEALIGITYAGAIALSLLVLERSATGTDEIREMLVGSIFTVSPKELIMIAILCVSLGVIYYLSRNKLLMITESPEEARSKGLHIKWWDFVFYSTFGLIVASSVQIVGVLMVFAFLIIPSVASMISVEGTTKRLVFGWIFGILGCVGGLQASLMLDWTVGPTIIAVFLALLIIVWFVRTFMRSAKA